MSDGENPKETSNDTDAKAMEDFAQLPSTMPPIGIDMIGYPTEESAKSVGEAINTWLHLFGKILNLKRLRQVVVSYNYDEALAAVDQGAPVSGPLKATNDEIAVGIAMTPTVLRDGDAMSVMVLNATYMAVLGVEETAENAALREQMIYTLANAGTSMTSTYGSHVCRTSSLSSGCPFATGFSSELRLAAGTNTWLAG